MSDTARSQGSEILDELLGYLARFVAYPSRHALVAHVLWIAHCYFMHRWDSTPRLAFLSAEPASGKTRALEVTELLVPCAVCAVSVSPAYLFRKVGSGEPVTILFDEIDTVFGPKAKENEEIRGLLNAGHRRGAVAGRCVIRGREIVTEEIPAYAAVALAGIGWLPDTILSRSIVIRMQRRSFNECIEPFRRRVQAVEAEPIQAKLSNWAQTAEPTFPNMPAGIQDRNADVWEALIGIADYCGGDWPERARAAAVSLIAESNNVQPSLGIRLLADIRQVFVGDRMFSRKLVAELCAIPDALWGDLNRRRRFNERRLAQMLGEYGIRPIMVRVRKRQARGYLMADLQDAWERYLPPVQKTVPTVPAISKEKPTYSKTAAIDNTTGTHGTDGTVVNGVEASDDLTLPSYLRRSDPSCFLVSRRT